MSSAVSEVLNPVDASTLESIQAVIEELQLDLAEEHQVWCNHVWKHGARFVVLPGKLPKKGMGIIATRNIKQGEQIAHVPPNLLYTTNSIPSSVKKKFPKLAGHALLAIGLVHELVNADSPFAEWIRTWPTIADLETSMPLLLLPQYRKPLIDKRTGRKFVLLPPAIGGIWIDSNGNEETRYESTASLPKQEVKLNKDALASVKTVQNVASTRESELVEHQNFQWMWLMVNTRSFYYDLPLRTKPKSTADMMCLCPFLDYFNHDVKGCNVSYDDRGFTVTADRAYKKGDEVVISYGAHSNDLLWTDYGFLLNQNPVDSVCIDAWMLDQSTGIADSDVQKLLEDTGYWRNYTVNQDGPCYRTEMAIRTQTLSRANWLRLANGDDIKMTDDKLGRDMRRFLVEKVLKPCISVCEFTENAIKTMDHDMPSPMFHFALERWKQIRWLAKNAAESV